VKNQPITIKLSLIRLLAGIAHREKAAVMSFEFGSPVRTSLAYLDVPSPTVLAIEQRILGETKDGETPFPVQPSSALC
jgi:hypothetical protein